MGSRNVELALGVIGPGMVGKALIAQLRKQVVISRVPVIKWHWLESLTRPPRVAAGQTAARVGNGFQSRQHRQLPKNDGDRTSDILGTIHLAR